MKMTLFLMPRLVIGLMGLGFRVTLGLGFRVTLNPKLWAYCALSNFCLYTWLLHYIRFHSLRFKGPGAFVAVSCNVENIL